MEKEGLAALSTAEKPGCPRGVDLVLANKSKKASKAIKPFGAGTRIFCPNGGPDTVA